MTTHLRRKLVLALATAGIAASLSSCGFGYPTDRPNTISNGGNDWTGATHVLAARVVASADGEGAFIATITRDADHDAVTFDSLEADGVEVAGFKPIEIQPHGMVNLAEEGPIAVTGDYTAGDTIEFTLGFSDGDDVTVDAVVVAACHEYEGITPSAAPKGKASESPSESPSESASSEGESSAYDCEYLEGWEPGEEEH